MTRSQRFHYFIDCNKWKIIGILMIVVSLAWISLAVYSNTRPTVFAYAVVNSPDPWSVDTSVIDDYKSYYNYKDSDKIKYMQNLHYDPTTFDADYDANERNTLPSRCCARTMYMMC